MSPCPARALLAGNNYTYTIEAIYPDGVNALSDPETFFLKTESFEARIRSLKINGEDAGRMRTNLGGKLNVSVELAGIGEVKVEISK